MYFSSERTTYTHHKDKSTRTALYDILFTKHHITNFFRPHLSRTATIITASISGIFPHFRYL